MAAAEPASLQAEEAKPQLARGILSMRVVVIVRVVVGFGVFAYLRAKAPEKLAALGATLVTDEIDFAEARSPSLSSGAASELPEPEAP